MFGRPSRGGNTSDGLGRLLPSWIGPWTSALGISRARGLASGGQAKPSQAQLAAQLARLTAPPDSATQTMSTPSAESIAAANFALANNIEDIAADDIFKSVPSRLERALLLTWLSWD